MTKPLFEVASICQLLWCERFLHSGHQMEQPQAGAKGHGHHAVSSGGHLGNAGLEVSGALRTTLFAAVSHGEVPDQRL